MDFKFNLNLLILCFSLSAVLSANEDVQLNQRYIVTQHFGREQIKNSGSDQVEKVQIIFPDDQNVQISNNRNGNLIAGSNRMGRAQNFVQFQPAASYQIVETTNNQNNAANNNGGTTNQFPLTSTTNTYRITNGQEQDIKRNVQDNLLSLIDLVENAGSNQKSTQFTQVNRVQNVTPNLMQIPSQQQNQPEIQYQQVRPVQNSNPPQIQYQLVQQSQNTNQQQIQSQFQNQPQVIYQQQNFNQAQNQRLAQNPGQIQYPQNQKQFQNQGQSVYPGNVGDQNQLPNRYGTKNFNSQSGSLDQRIEEHDDKIGKTALISILGGG